MAKKKAKKVLYPENLYLKKESKDRGISVSALAEHCWVNRKTISQTINGHYKGINIVPKIRVKLGLDK